MKSVYQFFLQRFNTHHAEIHRYFNVESCIWLPIVYVAGASSETKQAGSFLRSNQVCMNDPYSILDPNPKSELEVRALARHYGINTIFRTQTLPSFLIELDLLSMVGGGDTAQLFRELINIKHMPSMNDYCKHSKQYDIVTVTAVS
jgi:hypothetical protein